MSPSEIVERLLSAAMLAAERRSLPESTYRLQFHSGFAFRDATAIVPYLRDLGITHCYASPYLKARPGSIHGYDIIDHTVLNPEIGTDDDYDEFVHTLHSHGLGQLLDTVPNHMCVGTSDNPWWNDVLENGPASRFAGYFDIAWRSSPRPELRDKVLLPVLAELYGDVLEAGELTLEFRDGAFSVRYGDRRFPVDVRSYDRILGHRHEELEHDLGPEDPGLTELTSILTSVRNLPGSAEPEPEKVAERQREKQVIKRRLATLADASNPNRDFIERNLALFAGTPGDSASFGLMDDLLANQCFRLSYWRVGSDEINYRRFFDVNDLAALAMEREEVFEAAHSLVLNLVADGKVDGLRIDHPDGLFDPAAYFRRLQERAVLAFARRAFEADPEMQATDWAELIEPLQVRIASGDLPPIDGRRAPWLYVVAEKILGTREALVETWPVNGTSGYDFLTQVDGLFVDSGQVEAMTQIYDDFTGDGASFSEVAYRKKSLILQTSLASELHMLTFQLDRLAQSRRRSRDFTFNTLRDALREVIACFPVYRSYIDARGPNPADRLHVEKAVRTARMHNPILSARVFRFIRDLLLGDSAESLNDDERNEQRAFVGKFQQVTAPVTAKGIEDTAFYVYSRLVCLNEVGGDPGRFGVQPEALHAFIQDRLARWPYALSPLSTHDTKRSEDVRARISVLSELPQEWSNAVKVWSRINHRHRQKIDDQLVPDCNEEYFLYQTLVGSWPLEGHSKTGHAAFVDRIKAYMLKSLHEAKVHSSWINPDQDYDNAVQEFVGLILDSETNPTFLEAFVSFQRRISHLGLFNSLSQTLLKLTLPGVADTYQGTEVWDFSLVDPDNRRPLDFGACIEMLARLNSAPTETTSAREEFCRDLVKAKEDGRIKLYVHLNVLQLRRAHPGLFTAGDYLPMASEGAFADHVFAFVRRAGDLTVIVAVPRLLACLISDETPLPVGEPVWQDTRLLLPSEIAGDHWRNIFTGASVSSLEHDGRRCLTAATVFEHFPIAVLVKDDGKAGQAEWTPK